MAIPLDAAAAKAPAAAAAPLVPVSWGELLDKIAILELKAARIVDPGKRANVAAELAALRRARDAALPPGTLADPGLAGLAAELATVNAALWDVEDAIRLAEAARDFGPRFVELARSVYRTNDRRAALKRAINRRLGSALVEEKSYATPPVDDAGARAGAAGGAAIAA